MFNQLFKCSRAIEHHTVAPLREQRLRYLTHCAEQGTARGTLRAIAQYLLVIIEQMNLPAEGEIRIEKIKTAAHQWASRQPQHHKTKEARDSRVRFIRIATQWARFLGRLHIPAIPPSPYAHLVAEFAGYMKREKGLSPLTIRTECGNVEDFLNYYRTQPVPLHEISIAFIDEILARKGSQNGYTRASIRTYAASLRAFFRYAEIRGWCAPGLASAIMTPRVFKQELLPAGPSWKDVQRLLASTDGDQPVDIRDRAILMLFCIYGLRTGEVLGLRLEDLDWEQEMIHLIRPKTRRTQPYPLSHTVGETILRYLKEVRPRSPYREVFLTLKAPFTPVSRSTLWQVVSRRLRQLDIRLKHFGPHTLRHACATRLLAEGLSLKEIGDHLGHRNPDVTRIYAKVDIAGLSEVADFDLEGLL